MVPSFLWHREPSTARALLEGTGSSSPRLALSGCLEQAGCPHPLSTDTQNLLFLVTIPSLSPVSAAAPSRGRDTKSTQGDSAVGQVLCPKHPISLWIIPQLSGTDLPALGK